METTFQAMTQRRRDALRGYVARGPALFRALLFLTAVAAVAWLLRTVHVSLGRPLADSDLIWIVPSLALAAWMYWRAGRWSGGPALRAAVRADLAKGVMAVHRVVAVEAVAIEEQEDEGPSFFVLADDGNTLLFTGQYLAAYQRNGFPWKAFEILEAPASRIFFDLVAQGDKLAPSVQRPALSWDEYKEFVAATRRYGVVDVDFEALKAGRLTRRPGLRS